MCVVLFSLLWCPMPIDTGASSQLLCRLLHEIVCACYIGIRNKLDERGVIPNSFSHIFTHISRSQDEQYLVRASYLEIYQEEIRDLLNKDHKNRLELRERTGTGVYVKDLSSFVAKSIKEIEHVMSVGNKNRSVG